MLLFVTACLGSFSASPANAADPPAWKTGASFVAQLKAPIGLRWQSNPIRDALRTLSRRERIAIYLDRRVPPNDTVDLAVSPPRPLLLVLDAVADKLKLGVAVLDNVLYVGPARTAVHLEAVCHVHRARVQRLPAGVRRQLLRMRPLAWEFLAEPRAVVASLAREAGMKADTQAIPHDLWPEWSLPLMPWTDRLSLVLAGFELDFEIDARNQSVRLVQAPPQPLQTVVYRQPAGKSVWTPELAKRFPAATTKQTARELQLTAEPPAHFAVRRRLLLGTPSSKRPPPGARTVYNLKIVNKPVGGVLKGLVNQLGLTPKISADAAQRLSSRVSFDVQNASLEQLLSAALTPARLAYRLEGKTLHINVK